jgi:hypothetical protein
MPFDPTTAQPESSGFDPSTAQTELTESSVKRSGYLTDPAQDEAAYQEAKRMYDSRVQFPGAQTAERFADNWSFNLTRPATGAVLSGQGMGFDYGKAVDRYYDDMVREGAGPLASGIAETAGTILSPVPFGKLKAISKLPGLARAGGRAVIDALVGAGEQEALRTQNQDRDVMTDLLTGGTTSLGMRGLHRGSEFLPFGLDRIGRLPEAALNQLSQAGARTAPGVVQPGVTDLSGAPTPEDLQRYYTQQLLRGQ